MISLYDSNSDIKDQLQTTLQDYFRNPYILLLDSNLAGWLLTIFALNLTTEYEFYTSVLTKVSPILKYLWKKNINYLDVDDNLNMMLPLVDDKSIVIVNHWNGKIDNTRTDAIMIEDCSMALGGRYNNGKRVGNSLNICLFEFNDTTLITGSGCILTFPSEELYIKFKQYFDSTLLSSLKMSESSCKNVYQQVVDLLIDDKIINMRKYNVMLYDEILCRFKNIKMYFDYDDVNNAYPTLLVEIINKSGSEHFVNFMTSNNIQTSCLELQSNECPNANELYNDVVLIPCGYWVDESKFNTIINILHQWDESQTIMYTNLKPRLLELGDYNKGILTLLSMVNSCCSNITLDTFKNVVDYISSSKFIYVIEMDNIIVATVSLYIDYFNLIKPKAFIEHLIVHPAYKRQKLGSKLLSHVVDACEKIHNGPLRHDVYIMSTRDAELFLHACNYSEDASNLKLYKELHQQL